MTTPQPKKRTGRRNQDHTSATIPQLQAPTDNSTQGDSNLGSDVVTIRNLTSGEVPQPTSADDRVSKSAMKKPRQNKQKQKKEQQQQNGRGTSNNDVNASPSHTSTPPRTVPHQGMLQSGISSTPAKVAAAYAGPTFHASPAPSALPMPKFFSQSVPNTSSQSSLRSRLAAEPESEKSDSSPSSENSPSIALARPNNSTLQERKESPLDLFFKADKAEKAKAQSNGAIPSANVMQPSTVGRPDRPTDHWASIYGTAPRNHSRNYSAGSGKDVFMLEMDDTSPRQNGIRPLQLPGNERSLGSRSITAPSAIPQSTSEIQGKPPHSQGFHQSSYNMTAPSALPPAPLDHPSPFNRPTTAPVTPRSADSTPLHHGTHNGSPLHYGNRNLSPLFKAAKNDSARRQSHLRREVPISPTSSGIELPGSEPLFNHPPVYQNTPREVDPSAVALEYLSRLGPPAPKAAFDHQIRAKSASSVQTGPPSIPELDSQAQNLPFRHINQNINLNSYSGTNNYSPFSNRSNNAQQQQPLNSSPDLKSMENNLKRILNLSTVGSAGVR